MTGSSCPNSALSVKSTSTGNNELREEEGENFQLGLPMVCIPSNPEQIFNAYDHSRKVPGFIWTHELKEKHIDWIINYKCNQDYWEK